MMPKRKADDDGTPSIVAFFLRKQSTQDTESLERYVCACDVCVCVYVCVCVCVLCVHNSE